MLPILYSFRRCPYAMRARWALLITGHNVEIREVDLKAKPRELLEVSPRGTVPVLVINDKYVINESMDIIIWALQNSKLNASVYNDFFPINQQIKDIIEVNDGLFKYHLDRFKYNKRFIDSDIEYHKNIARNVIISLNKRLLNSGNGRTKWLLGEKESLADLSLWPFVRQFLKADTDLLFDIQGLDPIVHWLSNYVESANFTKIMTKSKPWSPAQRMQQFLF